MWKFLGSPFLLLAATIAVCFPAAAAGTFTVTNVNDSGPGSLRQAMLDATKANGGTIEFAIGSGVQTIRPKMALPEVSFTTIDGRTQPGYVSSPLIEIDGSLMSSGSALTLYSNSAVYGLVVNRAPGGGISIQNSHVEGCYIGVDPTGKIARSNSYFGVQGTGVVAKNLIAANQYYNVNIGGGTVRDNVIGLNSTGAAFGNHDNVRASGVPGQTTVVRDNVIGGGFTGVSAFLGSDVFVFRNRIGVNQSGSPVPNGIAVSIDRTADFTVSENVIAFNSTAIQVRDRASMRARFLNNSIHSNGFGIDLVTGYPERVTPNDSDDGDVGPNNLTNYPVLTSAAVTGSTTRVKGTMDSHPNTTFMIELFVSPSCNASGYGEGKERALRFWITTDGGGNGSFDAYIPAAIASGHVVTALATSDNEGTSEFSKCVAVEGAGLLSVPPQVTVYEGDAFASVTVLRQSGAVGTASVKYTTVAGTAKAGTDYTPVAGTLTFANGETSKTIQIPLANDTVYDGMMTFDVVLSEPSAATLSGDFRTLVRIHDEESVPTISSVGPMSAVEGDSGTTPFVVSVTLSHAAATPLTVKYMTAQGNATAGVDFIAASGDLVFAPGETVRNFSILIIGDKLYEGDEDFSVAVSINGSARNQYAQIENDDPEPTLQPSTTVVRETDGTMTAAITLTVSQPLYEDLWWEIWGGNAVAGEDYKYGYGDLRFRNETTKTIHIPILGDEQPEDRETFDVVLVGFDGMSIIERFRFTMTIEDDDVGIGPGKLSIPAGETRDGLVQIGGPLATDSVFTLSSSAPSHVSVAPTVVIPAGQTRARFPIRALAPGHREEVTVTTDAGESRVIQVLTYTKAELTLSPSELTLYPGQVVTVNATFAPAGVEVQIPLASDGKVEVPQRLVIGVDGRGSFTVKAIERGSFAITATLPSLYGSESARVAGFVVDAPEVPTLHSITPPNGSIAGGTRVDVRGALFRTDCTLSFGGVPATMLQYVDASTFEAIAPPHAAGTVDVTLTCGSDVTSLPRAFTYRGAGPHLSLIAPASGSTGGGTYVRISGSGFASSCWPFFDGVASPEAAVYDANTITAVVPAHAAGKVDVRLLCTGSDALLEGGFTFVAQHDAAAQIAKVEPYFGAPGDVVTLHGTGFRPSDVVAFEGVVARVLESTPETHTVVVPDLPPGRVNVTIGAGTNVLSTTGPLFTVGEASPPRITRVLPATTAAGAEITLEGTSMRPPYTFAIEGVALPIVSLLPTRAVVRVPASVPAGTYPIAIMNAANQIATLGPALNVRTEGVVITSVAATCAATDGGIDVTITGSGFATGAIVTFDDIAATNVVVIDGATITARVPANYAGDATILVKNMDGSASTLTNAFRYASPFDPSGCTARRMRSVRH